jgi:hypothetical protein
MLVAKESCQVEIAGTVYNVQKGQTRVDESHPLVAATPPEYWEPLKATFEVEQATAAPEEKRKARVRQVGPAELEVTPPPST